MPKVRMNSDGWLALPVALRRRLRLAVGTELDLELVKGAIVLRPAHQTAAAVDLPAEEPLPAATRSLPAATPEPEPAATVAPTTKRGPGRPRKTPAATTVAEPKPKARSRHAMAK